jgi:predicted RNA binding protein YcfA (HicA-like mRNA interferase family)
MKQISGKEFRKLLEKNGWVLVRVNCGHFIYMKDDREERIAVPVHKNTPLKLGLLKALMKVADIQESDL